MTTATECGVGGGCAPGVVGGPVSDSRTMDHLNPPAHFAEVLMKQSSVPLFSQPLLTVEQLVEISVDPDIQTAVDHFLKGLTTQMFARIVRNGSAEVGQWLGAKVQSERDGWTALLRMAMTHIELHRKAALHGQVVVRETLNELLMLLDCFQLGDEARAHTQEQDDVRAVHSCLGVLADCCNALMEDRFRCFHVLGHGDDATVPDSLSAEVQGLQDRLTLTQAEKEALEERLEASEAEASRLRQQNAQFAQEMQKLEEKVRKKHEDLEGLKSQLKEFDKMVKFRRSNVSDKCVETTVDIFKNPSTSTTTTTTTSTSRRRSPTPLTSATKTKFRSTEDVAGSGGVVSGGGAISGKSWTSREHVYTQTFREPSLIELSEEKLRVLKERAKKLESSLHGAITTMDKLRKAAPSGVTGSGINTTTTNSSDPKLPPSSSSTTSSSSTAVLHKPTFVAVTREGGARRHTPRSWMATSASFQVTNAASSSVTAPVPKLGHFQPTERRCFSERPAGKNGSNNGNINSGGDGGGDDTNQASAAERPSNNSKVDSRRVNRGARGSQVSKCLRCQKIFTATDNHKLACCFHSKGKERMEVYNDDGQLVRVQYVWKCCHHKGDNDGCCYGHHV